MKGKMAVRSNYEEGKDSRFERSISQSDALFLVIALHFSDDI